MLGLSEAEGIHTIENVRHTMTKAMKGEENPPSKSLTCLVT